MTVVLDSHRRIRSGEVSPTLTTKCNVAVLDVCSGEEEAVKSEKGAAFKKGDPIYRKGADIASFITG